MWLNLYILIFIILSFFSPTFNHTHLQLLQRAHLGSTTIVEASRSLSLRGTSGERAGERGTFHRIGAANWNPLSLTLSPLLCRGERESTSGMVVLDAPARRF